MGGRGDDDMYGNAGDDLFTIGTVVLATDSNGAPTTITSSGNDTIRGGTGTDWLTFTAATTSGLVVNLKAGSASDSLIDDVDVDADNPSMGGIGTVRLGGIENVRAGSGADNIKGDNGNNYLDGGAGNDIIEGGKGDDTLDGGEKTVDPGGAKKSGGNDSLTGDAGDDLLRGGEGTDTLVGGADDDTLEGGEGADELYGDAQTFTLNDTVGGDDVLDGGEGADELYGGAGDDVLRGGGGNDALYGDTTLADTVGGDDTLEGGEGNDSLFGGAGDDVLRGGAGDDRLEDGDGEDIATGGAGVDTFVISASTSETEAGSTTLALADHALVITDFEDGEDKIDLTNFDTNLAAGDLTDTDGNDDKVWISQVGTDVYVVIEDTASTATAGLEADDIVIVLQDFEAANLTATDFMGIT